MRKILSLVMVLAMILSAMSLCVLSSSASYLEDMGYDVWPEGQSAKQKGYQVVEALYFENEPTIDGSITEAEWGEVTRTMNSAQAAKYSDSKSMAAAYFYWEGAVNGIDYQGTGIEYDLWLRWDEENFYVGVKVRDYDGHSLKHGLNNTWNGDAVQFRVDANYNFADTSRDRQMGGWSDRSTVPNIMCGYSQVAGGFVECYDDASASAKGLTAYSNPKWGAVDIAVAPAGDKYSDDTAAGYTTYEIAIPWKYILQNGDYNGSSDSTPYKLEYREWDFDCEETYGIGRELGMTLSVLNAASGETKYNSYLSWGSGVTGANANKDLAKYNQKKATCTGANMVVLSDGKVDPNAGSFKKYDPSKLDRADNVGSGNYDKKFIDYLSFDFTTTVAKDKLTTLTYDKADDMLFWGSDTRFHGSIRDVKGEHGNVLVFDRAISPYDIDGLDEKGVEGGPDVFEVGKDPIPSFYIETGFTDNDIWKFPTSYTLEFDVRYLSNDRSAEGRESVLTTWFGGADGISYECGYSFSDRQFIICPAQRETEKMASKNFDLVQGQWYNWKFQFDNDTCTVRLLIDDEVIFNVYNRYFFYSSEKHQIDGTPLYAWFINTQVEFDNVKIYNFYDYVNKDAGGVQEPVGPGTTGPQKPTTEQGGSNINTQVQNKGDNFVVEVSAKDIYKTATQLSYTFTMNSEKYEFVGVEGLAEDDYKVEEKDGKYTITITNLDIVKDAKDGAKLFDLVFKAKVAGADGKDLDLDLKDEYKYTVVTGDTMVWTIAFATLMVVSAAAAVVYKKRKATDII